MGKSNGLKWAESNKKFIESALQWDPTPGNSDPRHNDCKPASDHFTSIMNEHPEFEFDDYDNLMNDPLEQYFKGWQEGLKSL